MRNLANDVVTITPSGFREVYYRASNDARRGLLRNEVLRLVARFGGFLGRMGDHEPSEETARN
jgi:hypothetical protein